MEHLDLHSVRANKARLGKKVGTFGYNSIFALGFVMLLTGGLLVYADYHLGWSLVGISLFCYMAALWVQYDLLVVKASGQGLNNRISKDVLTALDPKQPMTPQSVWQALSNHWQTMFIMNHLILPPHFVDDLLTVDEAGMEVIWQRATILADHQQSSTIEPGHVAAALLLTSPNVAASLTKIKHKPADVEAIANWLGRELALFTRKKPKFGGIGRDWANGYTPRLNRFGTNISRAIEQQNIEFGTLADSPGVTAVKAAFSQGTAAVALVGEEGIGKTSHAYALAQNLLAETKDRNLEHRQIIALSPTQIISVARGPGDLEYIISALMNEAAHAGNIVLFLDDAQLFFQDGPGSMNATQILLPVLQSRRVQFVFALTPRDFQQLKSTNQAFANLLTPVVLQELSEAGVLESLTRAATNFEIQQKLVVSYEALLEAYRLSGRYEQDLAYPGKAIQLLEQSLVHNVSGIVNAQAVQAAIEQTKGVKAGSAAPAEADQLLNLEDQIHQRMINQSRAVSVVANALRRARAGVSNPNRPVGSFLFLGPTGVGKTELAKSIAATYFGDATNMIRLDMSEYQQESDVARMLSGGEHESSNLLLQVRQKPFSVVLLDEIEKAHPNILNLLLQMLDEGQLTDDRGRKASFKDTVVIATSNAGADTIRERIEKGEELESFEKQFIDELINGGQFKPELLNRFDEIVLFRPLKPEELAQVVGLMLNEVNQTLSQQQISVELSDAAVQKIVEVGNDPRLGARPMRRAMQRAVEDVVAQKILKQEAQPGDHIALDASDLSL
ncbi:ATP-dependent Clp protease ATP-binding subunit [Candidatus Saccharibacteria bacterium]|nr:ATP-dependent Clp protease ATP-binding subunit [Candidatus Saccharibacteria bacterium]